MEHVITRNNHQTFQEFFERWIIEQNQLLQELVNSIKEHEEHQYHFGDQRILLPLVQRLIQHYEGYYIEKSTWAEKHITYMFKPKWLSTLEDAILWIGGWHPIAAINLLCSKTYLQIEPHTEDIARGLTNGDLSGIWLNQVRRVEELHLETIMEEDAINEMLAELQATLGDAEIADMNYYVKEVIRVAEEGQVDMAMERLKESLVRILKKADNM